MQKTNFDFEVIIHDDASSDNNSTIIQEFQKKYPDLLVCIFQKENQYSKDKAFLIKTMIQKAKGKYIAMCEGDDYWTDPYKLQKQVDFLEANDDCVVVCHDAIVVNSEGNQIEESAYPHPDHKRDFTSDELMRCTGNVLTLTRCFRNVIPFLPPELKDAFFGDTVQASLLGQYGYSKYLPEKMAAYRFTESGVCSGASISNRLGNSIRTYESLSKYYAKKGRLDLKNHFKSVAYAQNRQHIFYSVEENNMKELLFAISKNFKAEKHFKDKLKNIVLLKILIKQLLKFKR
jgi:glycosyltransferase involved in cell wall biosynthesis